MAQYRFALSTIMLMFAFHAVSPAQILVERPFPNQIPVPDWHQRAIENGTRSPDGRPGPNYWQQFSEYDIQVTLYPEANRLSGKGTIIYHNQSPDTLESLHLDLDLNIHKKGAIRLEESEVTDAFTIKSIKINGNDLSYQNRRGVGYKIDHTRLIIVPDQSLKPGETVDISIEWDLDIPQSGGGGRMGYDSGNVFFLAYWYPRMAVYDDLEGWHPDPFLGRAEFYHGFGNYSLSITAPYEWVVMSTGTFLNPEEVLAPHIYERYLRAHDSVDIVRVIDVEDFGRATVRHNDGKNLTWNFRAENVRDVAFSATKESIWDAAKASIGDKNGDGNDEFILVNSFWREYARNWSQSIPFQQHSISFLSKYTGFPYPWPHMTAVEAGNIIGGGMEFPMMTVIGDYNRSGANALYSVTLHELAHMWIPLIVSSDERRYSWFDEGYTEFHTNEGMMDYLSGVDFRELARQRYLFFVMFDREGEMMRWSDLQYTPRAFGHASYTKPATILTALQGVLGDEVFMEVHRELFRSWNHKLINPFDWFNLVESVSGKDLFWFWRSWYFETWTMDHEVVRVEQTRNGSVITIRDNGDAIMPVDLTITLRDGKEHFMRKEVNDWILGRREIQIQVPYRNIVRVEIDANRWFPDTDRSNNVWIRN